LKDGLKVMWLLYDTNTRNRHQAFSTAIRHAGLSGMAWEAAALFEWAAMTAQGVSRDTLSRMVHEEYGRSTSWQQNHTWLIALPWLRYEREREPVIGFHVQPYLVASIRVEREWSATAVGPVAKASDVALPLSILLASPKGEEMAGFPVLALEKPWTTWRVEGVKKGRVKYHEDFLQGLRAALARHTVVTWLRQFGAQGEELLPYVTDDLYTLLEAGLGQTTEVGDSWTYEDLEASLRQAFGYSGSDARAAIDGAKPPRALPFEEAMRLCLQYTADRR
jgi:hypothetical protein